MICEKCIQLHTLCAHTSLFQALTCLPEPCGSAVPYYSMNPAEIIVGTLYVFVIGCVIFGTCDHMNQAAESQPKAVKDDNITENRSAPPTPGKDWRWKRAWPFLIAQVVEFVMQN